MCTSNCFHVLQWVKMHTVLGAVGLDLLFQMTILLVEEELPWKRLGVDKETCLIMMMAVWVSTGKGLNKAGVLGMKSE